MIHEHDTKVFGLFVARELRDSAARCHAEALHETVHALHASGMQLRHIAKTIGEPYARVWKVLHPEVVRRS